MWKKDNEFKFRIGDLDRTIDESGNKFIALRKIEWGCGPDNEPDNSKLRLDIRKYYMDKEGNEKMSSGVSFLTEEGPHELTHALVEEGYGDTAKLCELLVNRPDYNNQLLDVDKGDYDNEYIDLRDMLGGDDDEYEVTDSGSF